MDDLSYAISADIILDGCHGFESYISSYTTGDRISRVVVVVSSCNIEFDQLQINFIGYQSTRAHFAAPNKAHHQFQEIIEPSPESNLPAPQILRKNQRYSFGFAFDIPDILPPSSCLHNKSAPAIVRAAHLRPPPSLGDATVSGLDGRLRDDFAPEACHISYTIQLQIIRMNPVSGVEKSLFIRKQMLRIKPALDRSLVLHPGLISQSEYSIRGEKTIYANRLKKTALGQLSAAIEDTPIRIWLPLRDPHILISQTVRITLLYHPEEHSKSLSPPQLDSVESQIIARTFHTTSTDGSYRPFEEKKCLGQPTKFHDKRFPPLLRPIFSVNWLQDETGGSFTTSLQVPVTLPRENFIPSFHTCLVSRLYNLEYRLNIRKGGSITLVAPLVISAKRDPAALPSYNATFGPI
ncbi:uncharacterized protein KD926_009561 [Aspergillus affinis]|uniref:uncharacterized protein n=1 Tax=Aspergillus affinis TaxID=1070780 RepID=UPI0022FF0386|nr:uncharacterized protein KD926_009561 [Aspergillus affinis]KAI9045147.1 hypothetical protein KD926_009561 [Aspergillus affinis]